MREVQNISFFFGKVKTEIKSNVHFDGFSRVDEGDELQNVLKPNPPPKLFCQTTFYFVKFIHFIFFLGWGEQDLNVSLLFSKECFLAWLVRRVGLEMVEGGRTIECPKATPSKHLFFLIFYCCLCVVFLCVEGGGRMESKPLPKFTEAFSCFAQKGGYALKPNPPPKTPLLLDNSP